MNPKKLARKVIPKKAIKGLETSYRLTKASVAATMQGLPARKLKIITVTGTNGKTTTCTYINEVLKAAGHKTAIYTTVFTEINGKKEANKHHVTVVHVWTLQKFLKTAKKEGVDYVVLEVSSHALDQHKLLGIPIEAAVVTNLTQEHLDYHGTMQNYASAKTKLLTKFNPKFAVLNADDKWCDFFAKRASCEIFTVGKARATNEIKGIKLTPSGTEFSLVGAKGALMIATKLIGEFNVYNASQAATVGQALGINQKQIEKGIASVDLVPGRMEPVNAGQSFLVLVDYAVTPDALEKVLLTLKKVAASKVRLVFGATGDRDKSKRPVMGEVAGRLADAIYLTDDETYTEDGNKIRAAVEEGLNRAGAKDKFVEIADRKEAIELAFKDATKGDVVVLAGLGHEDYRNMGGKKVPWAEKEIATKVIKEILQK